MTTHTLYKIANALHVSTDYIVTGKTLSDTSDNISLLIETLSPDEKEIAERLIQLYLRGLSLRESTIAQKYEDKK